jgi:hypothetical protein
MDALRRQVVHRPMAELTLLAHSQRERSTALVQAAHQALPLPLRGAPSLEIGPRRHSPQSRRSRLRLDRDCLVLRSSASEPRRSMRMPIEWCQRSRPAPTWRRERQPHFARAGSFFHAY